MARDNPFRIYIQFIVNHEQYGLFGITGTSSLCELDGKGGVSVDTSKEKHKGTSVNVGKGGVNFHGGKGTNVIVGGGGGVSMEDCEEK
ncbi:hypothetical protein TSUD_307420 [Trifolium subterraneum]|nr:hypothetical protein TSUD_307420 [Trifolium subterraneum]